MTVTPWSHQSHQLHSADMAFRCVVTFGRLIGVAGLGAALGAAVAGLIALVSGQAFQPASTWLTGLPILTLLGAGIGALVAPLTRRWFLPASPARRHGDRRRLLLFTAAGLVVVPLALAAGQLHAIAAVTIPLMTVGTAVTLTLRTRALRRIDLRRHVARPVTRSATTQ